MITDKQSKVLGILERLSNDERRALNVALKMGYTEESYVLDAIKALEKRGFLIAGYDSRNKYKIYIPT